MDNPATAPIVGYSGSASQGTQAYWLNVAWRALQAEDRGLVARIESGDLDASIVADVVTAAARRVLRNPDGHEEESGAIDDYQEGWKNADSTEDVYFTAAELRRLQPDPSPILTTWSGSSKYC